MTATLLRRPRAVLVLVGVAVGVALLASVIAPGQLKVAGYTDPGSQSARALRYMQRGLGFDPEPGMVILARSGTGFRSRPGQDAIATLVAKLSRDPAVGRVETAFGAAGVPYLLTRYGHDTLLLVHFRSTSPDTLAAPIDRLRGHLNVPGVTLSFTGYAVNFLDANRIARTDLVRAELIAFPLLGLLLVLIFRGLVPAGIPLAIGGVSVIGAVACLRLLSNLLDISIFALNLAVLLGLGLAVDYGLLLVSRYREEAQRLGVGPDAVRATVATAGHTVLFSSGAITGACASLLLFPQGFIYSMGIAGMFVSLFSAAAALLITPPLLLIAGHRIGERTGRRRHPHEPPRWYRWATWVMSRHIDMALVGTAVLIAAAAPALLLVPTLSDRDTVPHGYSSRAAADTASNEFSPSLGYPLNVAVALDDPRRPAEIAVSRVIRAADVVAFHTIASPSGHVAVVQLALAHPPYSAQSQQVVKLERLLRGPESVGGRPAEFVDLKRSIAHRAPFALALAALSTIIVVFLITGSLVLPIKALVFNALSISAVFGLLVLIFQKHVLGLDGLVGYAGPSAIETTVSVVIVASTFGLATDYSILLLARITEEHEAGHPDEHAVALGIERSGPVITSSALLLAVALLALTSSKIFLVKQLTVGQALGVALDASIIRMLLVPAFMRILGRANWWAPKPLKQARTRLRSLPGSRVCLTPEA